MKHQIIIVHGGDSFNTYKEYLQNLKESKIDFSRFKTKGWKSSLNKKLGRNFDVISPSLPNSANAKYIEWKIYFDKLTPFFDNDVILLGHSLGAIFLLKYLSTNKLNKDILGLFLVSAPYPSKNIKEFSFKLNVENIEAQCKNIFMYHSQDDIVVGYRDFEQYKIKMRNAKFRTFKHRGHFNQSSFPEIVRDIKNIS